MFPQRGPQKPSELGVVHPDAAGIDVHSEFHFVAVPAGRDAEPVRRFGAFTEDIEQLADWLQACGVRSVAMESTGVYWIPLFELLERRGFQVILVDPRQLKSVPGRKSDVQDCQWLQQLHTFGLLAAAFRPLVSNNPRTRRADLCVAGVSATAGAAGRAGSAAHPAHAEVADAEEPQAGPGVVGHHGSDGDADHRRDPERRAQPADTGAAA